jgi:Fe-S-cluster-containing dehydrogenase component
MEFSRREFMKKAGVVAALGLAGGTAFELLEPGFLDAAEVKKDYQAFQGKHWGMVVDLSKFHSEADVEPLVKACHVEHNVPEIPGKQNIKWIWGTGFENAFPFKENPLQTEHVHEKPIVVMCNHCENPPCVRVCPTQATFKREHDGIVLMDMHRCIGCRFCMAACPYGARSFNFSDPRRWLPDPVPNPKFPTRSKGVVEKCNFCAERLAVGKVPACVEAAKDNALIFGDLADERSEIRKALRANYSIRRKNYLGTGPSVYYLV